MEKQLDSSPISSGPEAAAGARPAIQAQKESLSFKPDEDVLIFQSPDGGQVFKRTFPARNPETGLNEKVVGLFAAVPLNLSIRPWWEKNDFPRYLCVAVDEGQTDQPPTDADWPEIIAAVNENLSDEYFLRRMLFNAYSRDARSQMDLQQFRREYYPLATIFSVNRSDDPNEEKWVWTCNTFDNNEPVNPANFSRPNNNKAIRNQLGFVVLAHNKSTREKKSARPPENVSDIREETDWLPELARLHPEMATVVAALQKQGIRLLQTISEDNTSSWAAEQSPIGQSAPEKTIREIIAEGDKHRMKILQDGTEPAINRLLENFYHATDDDARKKIIASARKDGMHDTAWLLDQLRSIGGVRRIQIDFEAEFVNTDPLVIARKAIEQFEQLLTEVFPGEEYSGAEYLWNQTDRRDTETFRHNGFEIPYFVPVYGLRAEQKTQEMVYSRQNGINIITDKFTREIRLGLTADGKEKLIAVNTHDEFMVIGGETVLIKRQEKTKELPDPQAIYDGSQLLMQTFEE